MYIIYKTRNLLTYLFYWRRYSGIFEHNIIATNGLQFFDLVLLNKNH